MFWDAILQRLTQEDFNNFKRNEYVFLNIQVIVIL